ncbi:hypothetical protein TSAR_000609 [Trichomalopsis sarcophagae]|uniref:Uncharacterized protein n=1 Tax=Trichomalopsis sarcophagae TaxID=543379 RepID=A0A232FAW0_9HYME|nr:hypothetical protein TSAR_000609 [Trichomalopsis sarcophagae]
MKHYLIHQYSNRILVSILAHPNTLVVEPELSSIILDIEQIDHPQPGSSIQHQNAEPGPSSALSFLYANHQTDQQAQNLRMPIPNNDVALEEEVNGAEFSDTDASLEDGSNAPRFIVERESVRHYRRFGYEGRDIQGTISQLPPDANVYDWLERCMRNPHRQLCDRGRTSNFMGITLNLENFKHELLWLSFRLIQNFHADDLWEMLFNTVQSTNHINITDRLSINCVVVESVAGSGRVKLTEETVNKRSILCIRNNDNLCLPRCLVATYAYAVRGQIRTACGSNRYCIPCNISYWLAEGHRCSNKCYKCMTIPSCDMTENSRTCAVWNRSFFSNSCFENYLSKGSFNKNSSVSYRHEVTENVIISLKKLYNGYIGWSDVPLIVLSNMRGYAERRDLLKYSNFMVVFGTVAHDATE